MQPTYGQSFVAGGLHPPYNGRWVAPTLQRPVGCTHPRGRWVAPTLQRPVGCTHPTEFGRCPISGPSVYPIVWGGTKRSDR